MNRVPEADAIPSSEGKRLLNLIERTGYNIIQTNGQRRYGPPPYWLGHPPPQEAEVFVGALPKNLIEDELVPFIERAGKIYEIRLMMNFFGGNRGYAFVKYTTPEEATNAIRELNGKEIRRGCHVGVVRACRNSRLFIGGVPQNKRQEEIHEEISKVVEGVDKVIVYKSFSNEGKNRGFAFVDFVSHRAAALARRNLLSGVIKLWKNGVLVDWAEPEIEVDEETMSQDCLKLALHVSTHCSEETVKVKVLFFRNINMSTTESMVQKLFEERTRVMIEKVKIIHNFGFIHFYSREDASRAIKLMNGFLLDGSILEVTWAKPIEKGVITSRKLNRMRWRMQNRKYRVKFQPETPEGAPALAFGNSNPGTVFCRNGIMGAVNNCQNESMQMHRLGNMLVNMSIGVTHSTGNGMTPGHANVSPPNAYDFESGAWGYAPESSYHPRM
ncbi:probable RNA-binding protein 46 [Hetaerina americana]|uniref:probable RNA-binding protein 46 n=1 Tax=Hetaerina americana TaxID=62018 RepID=UPI003A7F4EA0